MPAIDFHTDAAEAMQAAAASMGRLLGECKTVQINSSWAHINHEQTKAMDMTNPIGILSSDNATMARL